jgi:hypothetical protein
MLYYSCLCDTRRQVGWPGFMCRWRSQEGSYCIMRKKSLIETNPYLQNLEKYRDSLITNVSSSTAIETGNSVQSVADTLTEVAHSIFIDPPKQKSTSQ